MHSVDELVEAVNDPIYNKRSIYNQSEFDHTFLSNSNETRKTSSANWFKKFISSYDPRKILSLFSIFSVIAEYDVKNYLISDIISGITVGVMQIPQVSFIHALF